MISIYTDSIFFEQQFLNRLRIPTDHIVYHSIHEYVASTADIKIAFTTDRCGTDYDIGDPERPLEFPEQQLPFPKAGFDTKLQTLSQASDIVFTLDGELHPSHTQFWDSCRLDNIYWIYPGAVNSDSFIGERTFLWNNFFNAQQWLYRQLPNKLAELTYNTPKPLMFDILLGRKRPHRDFIYTEVENNNLRDKVIMTYFADAENLNSSDFIWDQIDSNTEEVVLGTHIYLPYCGINAGLSAIIPIEIFNKTAYSIIAETNFDNSITFFTEKTAKPLLARRLFVAFSGYKFLENLRKLGFQTFDNVIDESYDLIEDNNARWAAAFEQVKLLCELDQAEVAAKIQSRVDHNCNLLMETDWSQQTADQIQEKLNKVFDK